MFLLTDVDYYYYFSFQNVTIQSLLVTL